MEVCPTETINATVEHIWELLTDPRRFARWSDARLEEGPARPVSTGDHFVLKKRGMRIRIEVLSATPLQRLGLFIHLPFGIVNHEQVQLTQLSGTACRVTFN